MSTIQDGAMTKEQVLALATCMLTTAHIDGMRPEESALIKTFYEQSGAAGLPAYATLENTPGDVAAALAAVAGDAGFAEQVALMCFMTAYADGHLTQAERSHVASIGRLAGVGEERMDALLTQVKDSLIGSLAHLPDAESVAALAKAL